MNVVLLVIDSLRACSLGKGAEGPATPFLDWLGTQTIAFRHAYATECWTLPSHCSMFTGLLPSAHGAHFQTMQYAGATPTLAEVLGAAGYHTELVTRNSLLDGSVPGITRGFRAHTRPLADPGPFNPCATLLALTKPRFRRQIRTSGFFHPFQRVNRDFVRTFARAMMPADRRALEYTVAQMAHCRARKTPYFFCCNLYDVHAPYPPVENGIFRPLRSLRAAWEFAVLSAVLPCLGGHTYLRPGFRLSESSRRLLLGRYHRAIELMDAKLAEFYGAARDGGLLGDTLLIVTSDHGEAFGDHGLYLHDASVYNTHLHVPLWVRHPHRPPEIVDDLVSTKDLFGLIAAAGGGGDLAGTLLDDGYRAEHPIAMGEHFHYPHYPAADPRYRQDLAAAIAGTHKVVVHRDGVDHYDLSRDPEESAPERGTLSDFAEACRRDGVPAAAIDAAVRHLAAWQPAGNGRSVFVLGERRVAPVSASQAGPAERGAGC